MNLSKELEISKQAAMQAAIKIMEIYNQYINKQESFTISYKSDNSPLTIADKESNNIIILALQNHFPQYAILSEESKDDKSRLKNKYCWIVDPLDGTKEFIKKNGEFTVNIALSYNHKAVLGVICVPATQELYYATQNSGTYYEKYGQPSYAQKIHTSDRTTDIRMVMSRSHPSGNLDQIIKKYNISKTKSAGSSLKGCLIAKGEAEAYYRFNSTMEWDTAAMQCIVEEAGAIFRQMDDTEMTYNRENSLNNKGFYIINHWENKMTLDK